jgi:hypothetical protein
MTNEKLFRETVDESFKLTVRQMITNGLPEGIDAVRVDITVHSAHGWHPTTIGRIAMMEEGTKFDLEEEKVK